MKITKPCVAALSWTLSDTLGEELDVLDDPIEFLIGGDDLFEVIENALVNCSAGNTVNLHIEPEQGFGEYNEQLVFLEPRSAFPDILEEGMTFDGAALPAGVSPDTPKDAFYTVTDIYPEHVVLDGNHPLAGIALRLTITVRAVREATKEEISRRTAGTGFFKVAPTHSFAPGSDSLH
ncbi:MAG: peptidylprolyl isomerase [Comamonadaceae bacterium CG1_02_60_18]|nr:MAG: peptidylprolyl isomerase [Comamonadaceae bacterium CG1_02_60_18]PIQ52002.1 MAG: peptidylprolyl isomerase [Comamonadaceae bacterium CG12_big_fil_rev_8_21_14_0_65_59_15]